MPHSTFVEMWLERVEWTTQNYELGDYEPMCFDLNAMRSASGSQPEMILPPDDLKMSG